MPAIAHLAWVASAITDLLLAGTIPTMLEAHLFPPEQLLRESALPLERCRNAQSIEPDAAHIAHQLCPRTDEVEAACILLWDHPRLDQPVIPSESSV